MARLIQIGEELHKIYKIDLNTPTCLTYEVRTFPAIFHKEGGLLWSADTDFLVLNKIFSQRDSFRSRLSKRNEIWFLVRNSAAA